MARIMVFGHDLLNVYRQWPVRHPSHNATFLHTEHGLTLWFHLAMCFGAAASVWNFNRVADALQLLTRMLLLLVGGHYEDDFNGIESVHPTQSGQATPRHTPIVGIQHTHPTGGRDAWQGSCRSSTRRCLGEVGRSALRPDPLVGLRSALSALAHMLNDIQPRFLPNKIQPVLQAVVFADAYVRTGERLHKAGYVPPDLPLPAHERQWLGIRGTDRPGGVL